MPTLERVVANDLRPVVDEVDIRFCPDPGLACVVTKERLGEVGYVDTQLT